MSGGEIDVIGRAPGGGSQDQAAREESSRDRALRLGGAHDFPGEPGSGPCHIKVEQIPIGFMATCGAHHTETDTRWKTEKEARESFVCDKGNWWSFVVHNRNAWPPLPVMVDLTGLWSEIGSFIQNAVLGHPNADFFGGEDEMLLYRYLHTDGLLELTVTAFLLPRLPRPEVEPEPDEHSVVENGVVMLAGVDTDRYLVVVHPAGVSARPPQLEITSAGEPGADSGGADFYEIDGVTYLYKVYAVQ